VGWGEQFIKDVANGGSDHPISRAVVDTVRRWAVPMDYIEAFLLSMQMDLSVTEYPTYPDLMEYVYGSAAVIGLEMVPVLEPLVPREVADPYARDLGIAFQLSNFIRDVGEDLQRGRREPGEGGPPVRRAREQHEAVRATAQAAWHDIHGAVAQPHATGRGRAEEHQVGVVGHLAVVPEHDQGQVEGAGDEQRPGAGGQRHGLSRGQRGHGPSVARGRCGGREPLTR